MFGTPDPWTIQLTSANEGGLLSGETTNLVALTPEAVSNQGYLFAFTARLHDPKPFYFQIWRPTGNTKEYQLVASRQVTPTITQQDQFENVRLTTLLGFNPLMHEVAKMAT